MQEIIDHTIFCYDGRLDSLLPDTWSSYLHLGAGSATQVRLSIIRWMTEIALCGGAMKELIVHGNMQL